MMIDKYHTLIPNLISQILGSTNAVKTTIYKKACTLVEKSSNYIYTGLVKIACPMTIIPYILWSYFMYYTTDLGRDAFTLPFVLWYVYTIDCDEQKLTKRKMHLNWLFFKLPDLYSIETHFHFFDLFRQLCSFQYNNYY